MQFTDVVSIAGTRRRESDGALLADARVARTGIQVYAGHEVGKPEMSLVRVYRPEGEVFSKDAMLSFAHRPVTNDHPNEPVTADNWKSVSVGNTVDEIARDGQFLRVPLMVSDASAIADIEAGKRQLSAGYSAELVWGDGKTPDGEAFDAMQTNIRANHVAIVARGRAGSEVRIGDADKWGAAPISTADTKGPDMPDNLRKVLVDGLQVETTDAGAQAIDKLQKVVADAQTKLSDAEKAHQAALAAKDAELAKAHAERDEAKSKVLDAAALDKLVQARADLIATAKTIAKDVQVAGLTDAEIRKAVVKAKLGDAAIADKADAYIDARFDILAEDAAKTTDSFREAVKGGLKGAPANDAAAVEDAAFQRYLDGFNRKKKEA